MWKRLKRYCGIPRKVNKETCYVLFYYVNVCDLVNLFVIACGTIIWHINFILIYLRIQTY